MQFVSFSAHRFNQNRQVQYSATKHKEAISRAGISYFQREVLFHALAHLGEEAPGLGRDASVADRPVAVELVVAGRRAVAESGVRIGAVALANQGETVLPWDRATGTPLGRAVVWQDGRSSVVCDRLASHAGRLAELTGLQLDACTHPAPVLFDATGTPTAVLAPATAGMFASAAAAPPERPAPFLRFASSALRRLSPA